MTAARNLRPRLALFLLALGLSTLAAGLPASAGPAAKRSLTIDDFDRFQSVEDPQCSPDGKWIAYTVSANDTGADARRSALWMVSHDGSDALRLTWGPDSDSTPRFSPDGRTIAFLSARPSDGPAQVWLLDRRGGEARALTNVTGDIEDFAWSPDGKRLVLVMRERTDPEAPPKPIVIDRFKFKSDIEGYLDASALRRLYLFDIATKALTPLTGDTRHDEHDPAWSPDGTRIAFVSNHAREPDRSNTNDIFVVEARPGALPAKLLTAWAPNTQRLRWSPDGHLIAYLVGDEPKYYAYAQDRLAVVSATGGEPRELTAALDRSVSEPVFSKDGRSLTVMVADDRVQYPARVPVAGGPVERLVGGTLVVTAQCTGGGRTAMLVSTSAMPPEIHALEGKRLRKLTGHNDAQMAEIQLGAVEDIAFPSEDGTMIHGLMVKPPAYQAGKKYPTILWIHGGPNMQDDHSLPVDTYALQAERHLLAAQGYVVLAVNYRGSSGRGEAFARAIFADWGNKEVADLRAAVDDAIRRGIADPDRLGIGGWSYGGILTNYTIAADPRFKAAVSGAGSAHQSAMFGSDQYAMQYEAELGPPWRNPALWTRVSSPYLHADRIRTPTLFMCGEKDFNVPVAGSEQMYQALRTLGVPTQLVVYPGEFHVFTRPSFIRDRQQRWIDWFSKHLNPAEPAGASAPP